MKHLPALFGLTHTSLQEERGNVGQVARGQNSNDHRNIVRYRKGEWVGAAPVNLVVTAVFEWTTGKYGERGVRYVWQETGHAAQNVYLQAVALGLANVVVGGFHDNEVQRILELSDLEKPAYVIPVGVPKTP